MLKQIACMQPSGSQCEQPGAFAHQASMACRRHLLLMYEAFNKQNCRCELASNACRPNPTCSETSSRDQSAPPVNHRCAPQGCSGDDGNVFQLTSAFTSASSAVQSRSPTHSTAVPRCIEAAVCVCLQSAVLQAIKKQSERESRVSTPTPTDQTPIPASYLSISFDAALTHCRISQLRDYPRQKTQSHNLLQQTGLVRLVWMWCFVLVI